MSRYDIDVGTDDGDEGFVKIFFVHAAGAEQTSMRSAGIAPLNMSDRIEKIVSQRSQSRNRKIACCSTQKISASFFCNLSPTAYVIMILPSLSTKTVGVEFPEK